MKHNDSLALLKFIVESPPISMIFVKIKAEMIFNPQLSLDNEDLKIIDNAEFGKKGLFGVGS